MSIENNEALTRYRLGLQYWAQVEKSEGFNIEGITPPDGINGLKEFICCDSFPCCGLVTLYAKLGLHRYNLLQGKNLQLSYVKKYNKEVACVTSYYITLVALDPTSVWHQNFQTQIDEKCYGELDLTSVIARPEGIEEPILNSDHGSVDYFYLGSLPEWPLDIGFNDRNRFYVVKDSELRDNAWIHLYLELAVASTDRSTDDHDMSDLKIVKAVIETKEYVEPPNERLKAKNAVVYILYKDSSLVDCKAIVRRTFDERRGYFSLFGEILSSEIIPKEDKNQCPSPLFTEMSLEHSEAISRYRMELKYCNQFAKSECSLWSSFRNSIPEPISESTLSFYIQHEEIASMGFEVQGLPPPPYGIYGLKEFKCDSNPCCGLVILYTRLGLHRYNLLWGTKLQLIHGNKYNKEMTCSASYYITLVAKDPDSGLHKTFQTHVDEECCGEFELTSYIARPQGTKDSILCCDLGPVDDFYLGSLPEWPGKNAFEDRKRFYVVMKSQLQDNDWISLYLELAIATTDRSTDNHDLSDLKILEVAIETKEYVDPPSERLTKKNAIVYIRYHGKARAGNPVDCIAIVRRTFGERKGKVYFSLEGRIAESIPKMGKIRSLPQASRRLPTPVIQKLGSVVLISPSEPFDNVDQITIKQRLNC